MRDPDRMVPLLRQLLLFWKRYPDLRLMQLLLAVCAQKPEAIPFYVEDDVLKDLLQKWAEMHR